MPSERLTWKPLQEGITVIHLRYDSDVSKVEVIRTRNRVIIEVAKSPQLKVLHLREGEK